MSLQSIAGRATSQFCLVAGLSVVLMLFHVTKLNAQESITIDDLKTIYEERISAFEGESESLHVSFTISREFLPGKLELLKWRLKSREAWFNRGWRTDSERVEDFSEEELLRYRSRNRSLKNEIRFLENKAKPVASVFDIFVEARMVQTRWRDIPDGKSLPSSSPSLGNLLEEYSETSFYSAVEMPNRVFGWGTGVPVLSLIPVTDVPHPVAGVLPPLPSSVRPAVPVNPISGVDELFAFDKASVECSLNDDTVLVEGLKPLEESEGVYYGVRAEFDLRSGMPSKIHFFTFEQFSPNEQPRIPSNRDAHRSFVYNIREFPGFGFYPKQITLTYRNGAVRLFEKGEKPSDPRSDGKDGYYEEMAYKTEVRVVERVAELNRSFFDFETEIPIPGVTISDTLSGNILPPLDFEKSVDESIEGASSTVRSGVPWKLILLWGAAIAFTGVVVFRSRSWRK